MPDLAMLDYFYGDEAEQFTFYRIPKVLFTDPSYRRISSDAKILYGLMLDRMGLSVRNGWLDEYNRVFIFFTLEDALEYLCCGHTKAVSLFGELDKAGLIERKKQGQGKPTKIYVKNFVRNAEVLTSEKRKSKVPQSGSQDFQKTASNNTEIKDTELSDTEPSIHPARGLPEDKSPAADAMDKAWAKSIPTLEDSGASRHCAYLVVDQVNPGLTDLFTRQFRKVAQEQQKSSVLQKLKQEPPARKPATPKKREPER